MKTDRSVRQIVKHRSGMLLAGFVIVIGMEVVLGGVLAARCGRGTACGRDAVEVSDVGLGEALAAVP